MSTISPFLFSSSCRSTSARNTHGLVCISWISGSNSLSHHVWLHCELRGRSSSLLDPDCHSPWLHILRSLQPQNPRIPFSMRRLAECALVVGVVGISKTFCRRYMHIFESIMHRELGLREKQPWSRNMSTRRIS